MRARPLIIAGLLVGSALAGCGKMGSLDQPAPMFGAQAKADYEARQRAAAEARAARKADLPPAPNPDAAPLSQAPYPPPIDGRTSPFGTPPPGAQPRPGVTPDQ